MIPPKKPENYEVNKQRLYDFKDRERFEANGDGSIMSHNAWHDVGTGGSPTGLKVGLLPYRPKEWK